MLGSHKFVNSFSSIAVVVPELLPVPPVQGGAVEHWVDEAVRRMVIPTRKLAVISRPAGVPGHEAIEYIDIPWTTMEKFFHSIKEHVTWRNPLRYVAKIQNVFSYGRRVAKAVRDFDVVYLHNEPNLLLFLQKRHGQKFVLHMHNDHLSMRLFRPFYRRALAKADVVLCISDYIRRQAVKNFPEYADRFRVVLNATDPEVFKPYGNEALCQLEGVVHLESDKRYLLYAGRLTSVKGVHVLIEAFREIHRRVPDVRLIITGSSFFSGAAKTSYQQELINLAEPVNEAIVFTGYLPHEKLKYLYSAVDIVVFPSIWPEPFGLVMIEAMASGTCLVASAVGGIPEVVNNGEDGILVEPANVGALAQAVCNILNNPEKMKRMETTGREKIITNFTWERLVNELETEFGKLK
jgi:spore coat protein SA